MNLEYTLKKILKKNAVEEANSFTQFCIKKNYRHRQNSKYFEDDELNLGGVIYQPDVYDFASLLAEKLKCSCIIDIGCGNAKKLVSLYPKFKIIGIDYGKNINECKKNYPFGTWIDSNLENSDLITSMNEDLSNSLIICSDVIEHLVNPTNLLDNIRTLMNYSQICLITTPDRDLTRGKNDFGPPKNEHHVREWNILELEQLLKSFNLDLVISGLTASSDQDYRKKTMFFVLGNHNKNEILTKLTDFKREHSKIIKKY